VEKLKNEITALESGLRAAQKRSREARDALLRGEEEHNRLQAEITSLTLSKQVDLVLRILYLFSGLLQRPLVRSTAAISRVAAEHHVANIHNALKHINSRFPRYAPATTAICARALPQCYIAAAVT
jgi:hypothetical protein